MKTTIPWKIAGILATLVIICSVPLYCWRMSERPPAVDPALQANTTKFVGVSKCAECHKTEYDRWKGSHHDLAMDKATDSTVLGNFDNIDFDHFGRRSTFYRAGDQFRVRTPGPDGRIDDFEIQYVFGVYPLQQYLIPFPGGRLQCLPIAWDVPNKKWYHLYPDENLDPKDWLYWTNAGQNWNGMCAECHSTNLQKNYDPDKDTYQTTWSEIDVGCEACHGPGSRHVAWAELPDMARPQTVPNYELAVRTSGIGARNQVELCAPCHSRRAILGDYTHYEADLLDSLLPVLLDEGLYFPDGQILDEVYVYGSFTQSKMYHRDVRCSDCHDMHSIKTAQQGNDLCLQCHRAAAYDTSAHHFHKRSGESGEPVKASDGTILFEVGSGSQCVQCHMPGRIYMGNDYRLDHSLRIPRPDLSIQLGSPNACNRCHWDKSALWADETITQWYGPGRARHYGSIIAAGRRHLSEAKDDLLRLAGDPLYPVVVRATALDLLEGYPGTAVRKLVEKAMTDPEALIRRTAVNRSSLLLPEQRRKLLPAMIYDPVAAVRMEAAAQMTAIDGLALSPEEARVFQEALGEYKSAMRYSADFAFGRFNLGNLYNQLNQTEQAMAQYRAATEIDDQFFMAKVNLAMLENQKGNNVAAEKLLRQALAVRDDLYEVHYSLGLLLAEEQRYLEAADQLETATRGMPAFPRAFYNLGQLWDVLLQGDKAQKALERAVALQPDHPEYLRALADHYVRHHKNVEARQLAQQLLAADNASELGLALMDWLNRVP